MKIKLVLYRKCNTGIHFNFPENNFVQAYQMYLDIFVNFLTTRICKKKFGRTMSGLKTEDTFTLAAVSLKSAKMLFLLRCLKHILDQIFTVQSTQYHTPIHTC